MLMQPRLDNVGSKYGKEPSEPVIERRNILDANQTFEIVISLLVEALMVRT